MSCGPADCSSRSWIFIGRTRRRTSGLMTLKVPVELLSVEDYRSLFVDAGFINIRDQRLFDPTPIPEDYTGGSFKSRKDFEEYRRAGSLMVSGEIG